MPLTIIFEDNNLLVLEKPPFLVTVAYDPNQTETLEDLLVLENKISKSDGGGVAHRLDKDTSGLLLVAKNAQTLQKLQDQFKTRTIKKEYLALVHGFITEGGEIEVLLERNPKSNLKFIVSEEGRESKTGFIPVDTYQLPDSKLVELYSKLPTSFKKRMKGMNYNSFTLVKCTPLTGRTHQIRVHLKHINHPIVSDIKYGGRNTTKLDLLWCQRQFLHASKLEFIHPQTQQKMTFESALPSDLHDALSQLISKH